MAFAADMLPSFRLNNLFSRIIGTILTGAAFRSVLTFISVADDVVVALELELELAVL